MIYVSQEQLDQVEYLIRQSIQGHHVLFDLEQVRAIFHDGESGGTDTPAVEHHIEKLISLPTLTQKKAYLERLDQDTHKHVVRTYFNIVENNLFEKNESRH